MRTEKLIFLFLVIVCTGALLFYFWGLRREFNSTVEQRNAKEEKVAALEGQVTTLRRAAETADLQAQALHEQVRRQREQLLKLEEDVQQSRTDSRDLSAKLDREKRSAEEKSGQLEKKLQQVSAQNYSLTQELEVLRKKFELIAPIREKLSQVEASLGTVEAKKGKEDMLAIQIDSIARDIESLNNYVLQLLQNSLSPIHETVPVSVANQPRQEEPRTASGPRAEEEALRAQLREAAKERDSLRRQYENVQEMLVSQQKELNVRAEKIFALQEKLMYTENRLFETRVSAKESEKNAAVLREKYVAEELEKSGLKIALDQTKQELAQLQGKFLALLSKIGGIFKGQDSVQDILDFDPGKSSGTGKIEVELIPQQGEGK